MSYYFYWVSVVLLINKLEKGIYPGYIIIFYDDGCIDFKSCKEFEKIKNCKDVIYYTKAPKKIMTKKEIVIKLLSIQKLINKKIRKKEKK